MSRPSGFALLPDCFSSLLRNRGTMGDFIPQTPSLGTSPQTPSSHYESYIPKKQLSQSDSVIRVKGTRFPCGVWGKAPIVPRYSRIPSKPHIRITNHTSQLSQSDSVVRVKGTEFPCGVWGKAPIVSPNRSRPKPLQSCRTDARNHTFLRE